MVGTCQTGAGTTRWRLTGVVKTWSIVSVAIPQMQSLGALGHEGGAALETLEFLTLATPTMQIDFICGNTTLRHKPL